MKRSIPIAALAILCCGFATAQAQTTPPASPSPAASPTPTPAPSRAGMSIPKGWIAVQGDTVARFVLRSPSAPQDIRIAPIGPTTEFSGDAGMQKVRDMLSHIPFPHTSVVQINVCNGTQPAILSVAQNAEMQTVMEQIIVAGAHGGAVVTYEIRDGKPDPEAERAIRSVCTP